MRGLSFTYKCIERQRQRRNGEEKSIREYSTKVIYVSLGYFSSGLGEEEEQCMIKRKNAKVEGNET